MRISSRLTVAAVIVLALTATAFGGKKDRKLSVGAYLSSAKIEIVSGDIERYETAIMYLDSLFINYGPHAEGLHLMGQIMVDYLGRTPDPYRKLEYVERLVAYNDSLHMCCENKDIKKKHRKDCDKFTAKSDSTLELHWRESYNFGIEQLNRINNIQNQLLQESDSSMKAMLQRDLEANADSCVAFMRMAVLLNASDSRGYVGVGSAYEKIGESEKAIEWLQKGLGAVKDSSTVLFSIAYNYIQLDRFCDAIPFFKMYTELNPDDTITLYNLAACYNNCQFLDSAATVNRQILQYAPQNRNALNSIGQYFGQVARDASDSVRAYQDAENEEQKVFWTNKRNEAFDSSAVYYRRTIEAHPDDILALEQFGTITGLRERYEDAAMAFHKLAELKPDRAEYWRAYGDFVLRLKDFDKAITAYEKTVELEPDDAETWDRLAGLYKEKGMAEKQKQAAKRVEDLKR